MKVNDRNDRNDKMDSHEQTPLIATVRVAPPRQRYRHNTVRRFCTVAFASTVLFVIFFVCLPALIFPGRREPPHHLPPHIENPITYQELQEILLTTPKEKKAEEWSRYYTAGPHLAGKNLSQAVWTQEKWQEFGIEASLAIYDVYINYPLGHRLALYEKTSSKSVGAEESTSKKKEKWSVKFEASLEEDVLEEDETTGLPNRIPTFHGYSASGNVTAPYVFVNYGTYQDFEDLVKANVSLKGKIAIAKYGRIFRGLKVKRAQELGMIGTVIYSDPGDDGKYTDEDGADLYPDGPGRNPSSVQRGSTQFLSVAPGDPTTPGYPSLPGVPRQPVDGAIPSIPSIPISYLDAVPILKALNGHGPSVKDFNKYWNMHLGLEYKGVKYNVGPSPDDLVLNLVNEQEYVTTPLWNVIGVINGTLADEVIVVGNHRDAWIAGGAGDPNSGSAAINEVIRGFGKALKLGWKPLRTIVFASWDGEEYGLIGSTEWVEEYLPWLTQASVAYVNMDAACTGPNFRASSSPLLNNIIYEITDLVLSPNQTIPGQTVRDVWDGEISTMGSGSDFTAFQDFAGIPSIDLSFQAGGQQAVYHYHSNYDSFHWMATYGDPGFHYHAAAAKILGLFVAKLSESPVIPLNTTDYADALQTYIDRVAAKLSRSLSPSSYSPEDEDEARFRPSLSTSTSTSTSGDLHLLTPLLTRLRNAASRLQNASAIFEAHAASLAAQAGQDVPWWKWLSKLKLYYQIRSANSKIKLLEREFLYQKGLDGRNWFKHVVFAPGLWTGYAGAVFPGLVESIDDKDYGNAERWVLIIEACLDRATASLQA